jgi:hypothetical protein
MNENVKQIDSALNALISVNKSGVKALLRSYKYNVPVAATQSQLNDSLTLAMSKSSDFTNDVLTLLKQASHESYRNSSDDDSSGDDTGSIIAGALQGLGMVTSTWQNTAQIKANASMYGSDTEKTDTILIVIGICIAVLLLGVAGVMVVRAAKK